MNAPGGGSFTTKQIFGAITVGQALGACVDWPFRVMAVVIAANVRVDAVPSKWPVHVYKSIGCGATSIVYALSWLTMSDALTKAMVDHVLPTSDLMQAFLAFHRGRAALHATPVPADPAEITLELKKQWTIESVKLHKEFLDSVGEGVKRVAYVPLVTPVASLLTASVLWPLRKIVSWMAVQTPEQIATLSQTPWRVLRDILDEHGGGLDAFAALYSGFPVYGLQLSLQFALNGLAAGLSSYGFNSFVDQATRFLNYAARKDSPYYVKEIDSPTSATFALYYAAVKTIRFAKPAFCLAGFIACLLAGRAVAMPLSLLSNIQLLSDAPAMRNTYAARTLAKLTVNEFLQELLFTPLRSSLWTWIGWNWKWIMLNGPFAIFGAQVTVALELQ